MERSKNDLMKRQLYEALKQHELTLYYQPQFNLVSEKFESVEALVRWDHPEYGLMYPNEFVPAIADNELVVRLGEWVLKTACAQIKTWQDHGLPLRVSVNVFARQLHQRNFVEMIMKTLHDSELKPASLELELTENIILQDAAKEIRLIKRLKQLGISIALDDFGAGYSSISYLKKIPLNRIKIDKSFVRHIHVKNEDMVIVGAIIAIATSLNLEVLAEGVESFEQLKVLLSQKCHEVQGNYFCKALPAKEVEQFLREYQHKRFL